MEPYLTRTSSSSSSSDGYISMDVDDGFHHRHHHHHRRHRSSSAKEFEFQSFSSSSDADRSPADELFYMGKLLPLHLPPRLQMVHTILSQNDAVELFATPAANTPYESCNISPSDSCQVSAELNSADYFRDYAISKPAVKAVTKRSGGGGFGSKLNWRYFKSLFSKSSGCSSPYASAAADGKIRPISRSENQCGNGKTAPFGEIRYKRGSNNLPDGDRRGGGGGGRGSHRRSFSGAFKRLSEAKKYSDASSTIDSDSSANNYRQILKRCSSSRWSPEMENPIQAAIAHCKRSQLCSKPLMAARDELGFFSGSAAAICGDGINRTGVCRG